MKTILENALPKRLRTIVGLLLILFLCTACPGSGPLGSTAETVYLNQRVQLTFPETSGLPSLTLNGRPVKDAVFTASSVYFDVTEEALGGEYVEETEAVVSVSGREILRQRLKILNQIFAGSELVVFTKNLGKAELEARLSQLNQRSGLTQAQGFTLRSDSFKFVAKSGSGAALINIGQQTTEKALEGLTQLGTDGTLNSSPNLLYGISGRKGVYWTSPRCDSLDELDTYSKDNWKLLKKADLITLLGVDRAHQQNLKGGGVTIPILDTGLNNGDIFDCPQTVFLEGHGTHIFNLADEVAEDAGVGSETMCNAEGFCSTAEFVNVLIDLEDRYLTSGKKVIVNLSISGSRGPDDSIDRAIWAQLKYYEEEYPNFLVVAAVGNHGLDSDATIANSPAYPASFSDAVPQTKDYAPLRNVIAVGAVGVKADTNKIEVSATNPKGVPVDILSPGVRVCLDDEVGACAPNRGSEGLTGSSFATALVSGVAAIMWSACQDMSAQEIRSLLVEQGKPVEGSPYKLVSADPSFAANPKCKGSVEGDRLAPNAPEQQGTLVQGATKSYRFTGSFNTPLRFWGIVRDMATYIEIYGPRGEYITASNFIIAGSYQYVFTPLTPPQEGSEYTLRVVGYDGAGSYTINSEYVAGPPEGRNILKPLVFNQPMTGVLAEGAFDDYNLKGTSTSPIKFTLNITDFLAGVWIEVFDVRNTSIERNPYTNYNQQFTFTPPEAGDYVVRVVGIGNTGRYSLFAER